MTLPGRLKKIGRGGLNTIDMARLQNTRRRQARQALRELEKCGHTLSRQMRSEIRDYAIDHLGWHGYAEWLAVYTAVAGRFKPGWLPDNYYFAEVMPRVNGDYHHVGRRRAMNTYLFEAEDFPDLAYIVNGLAYDRHYQPIQLEKLPAYLCQHTDDVVLKADNSGYGTGVRILRADRITPADLAALEDGVVQARIIPHEFFDQFRLGALPTLRIGTVINDAGQPEHRICYLKLGRAGHENVLAHDSLRIPVDPATGRLADTGFKTSWRTVQAHPDTGVTLGGLTMPMIQECINTALRLHAVWPLPRFVSWDMVPDHNGRVQVMEWEGGVVRVGEATQGPCFADLGWDRLHLTPSPAVAGLRAHPIRMRSLLQMKPVEE